MGVLLASILLSSLGTSKPLELGAVTAVQHTFSLASFVFSTGANLSLKFIISPNCC
jgi:hypothetical protein